MVKERNELVDILKFAAAVMVVGIHCGPLNSFSVLWNNILFQGFCRIAVPFFFTISAYFLFRKYTNNRSQERQIIINYVKRMGKLYMFWFIVLFPVIYKIRYLGFMPNLGRKKAAFNFLKEFIWSSSFQGSWYLNACIVCACLIFWLQKRMNIKQLMVIGSGCFIFTVLVSAYYEVFSPFIGTVYEKGLLVFSAPYNMFLAGMIYFVIGKYIAESNKEDLIFWKCRKLGLIVSIIGVFLEALYMHTHSYARASDCFFMLLPATYFIVINAVYYKKKFYLPKSLLYFLRNSSVIIYIVHFVVLGFVNGRGKNLLHISSNTLIQYIVVLLLSIFISAFLLILERYKLFRWLKYCH